MNKYLIVILLACASVIANAQHEGIERHFNTYSLEVSPTLSKVQIISDTCLDNFHLSEDFYHETTFGGMLAGNNGQAFLALNYFEQNNEQDFIFFNPYLNYTTQSNEITFFDARKPFAKFQFMSGPRDFEDVRGIFTANPSPFLNFGLSYRSTKTLGNFSNSETRIKDFTFWQAYTKKRYQNHFTLIHNASSNQLFGGILNDTAYTVDNQRIENLAVRLNDAEAITKHQEASFSHELRLGHMQYDTIITDTDSLIHIQHKGKFSIYQNLTLSRNWRIYSDIPSDFYENIYLDSISTHDSVSLYSFSHTAGIQYFIRPDSSSQIRVFAGIENDINKYHLPSGEELIYNHHLTGKVRTQGFDKFDFASDIHLGIAGRKAGDIIFNNKLHYYIDSTKQQIFKVQNRIGSEEVNYFYENYASNHYQWNNNFDKAFTIKTDLSYLLSESKFEAYIRHAYLKNNIYFDTLGLPNQNTKGINVFNIGLGKTLQLGHFGIRADVSYQLIDNDETLHLPNYMAYADIFYENWIFDNHMNLRVGVSSFYYPEYKSYTYIPATGFFALQNEENSGSFPLADAYLSFKVKRFRAFFRYSNVSQSLLNLRGYSLLHYPNRAGGFYFGFSWEFYD